jgi:hypothetical protein
VCVLVYDSQDSSTGSFVFELSKNVIASSSFDQL